jgi:Clp amino terminal domain, pathogenicity island component/Protein of unknown function (DUF664)
VFERFTDRARRVVVLAQQESRLLNHNYIGQEHILLGLIDEGEGIAATALGSLGISLVAVRAEVEEMVGRGRQVPSGHIPFTPRAKKTFELALREALRLGHNNIGTEHILLGLIREGQGVGAQVLVRLGGDLAQVRHAGHADIVRESIDGATIYELMAAAEGWPATEWLQPWEPGAETGRRSEFVRAHRSSRFESRAGPAISPNIEAPRRRSLLDAHFRSGWLHSRACLRHSVARRPDGSEGRSSQVERERTLGERLTRPPEGLI